MGPAPAGPEIHGGVRAEAITGAGLSLTFGPMRPARLWRSALPRPWRLLPKGLRDSELVTLDETLCPLDLGSKVLAARGGSQRSAR